MRSAARTVARLVLLCAPLGAAAGTEPVDDTVRALRQTGDAALQRGDAADALAAFERAAALQHDAAIELGIVRSLMQHGDYRRALAFAGHTAFAHSDAPQALALYVWLLRVGGQAQAAQRLLTQALQRAPDDGALRRALALLDTPADDTVVALAGPVPNGALPPPHAAAIGNATLLPDGQHAVVPSSLPLRSGPLWLRNGLGRTVRAEVERHDVGDGLALLRLIDPIDPWPAAAALVAHEPFPGSPAYVVAFGRSATEMASWPQMHLG